MVLFCSPWPFQAVLIWHKRTELEKLVLALDLCSISIVPLDPMNGPLKLGKMSSVRISSNLFRLVRLPG